MNLVTLLWMTTGAALVAAVLCWVRMRKLAERLNRLTESYWDLRYEVGQLSARVGQSDTANAPASQPAAARPSGVTAFVPLSSLKR